METGSLYYVFPFNHCYDDNDFIKCTAELSYSSYIEPDWKNITKCCTINEDDNDIIGYQGDIDPIKVI